MRHTIQPCAQCGEPFEPRNTRAIYCRGACRTRAHRTRVTDHDRQLRDLLARQTEAVTSGADPALLATLAREAERVLGRRRHGTARGGGLPRASQGAEVGPQPCKTQSR